MAATALADEVHRIISTAVDGAFYRAVNPDLAAAAVDPVRHYAETGWREGRDPAPWFSTAAYLKANRDVAKSGRNPLHHYLTRGRRQGREIARSKLYDSYLLTRARRGIETGWSFEALTGGCTADAVADEAEAALRDRALVATAFDAGFYAGVQADVIQAGFDPLDHFMSSGWREGRDPTPDFSVMDYLETYPDIAEAGVNPFVHYLLTGRAEGRIARNQLGFRYEIIKRLRPLGERVDAVARASAQVKVGSAAALAESLAGSRTGLADLHLTFSHDDYTVNTGGVQLCLQREGARIAALGLDHLHLYPAKPWPVVRPQDAPGRLGLVLNGVNLGIFAPATVARILSKTTGGVKAGRRSFAIHSLLGHTAAETAQILAAVGLKAGYFWLHDFASLCAGFHLLRNDVEDCAAPPPDSPACGICVYGPWRARHLGEHRALFEALSLTVVSPSQPTLDLWLARSAVPHAGTMVLPHARLVDRGAAPKAAKDRPFRLAFAGMPVAHKGWEVFRDLVQKHGDDPRFEFLHLGGRTPGGLALTFHKVVVTDHAPRAMQEAIERFEVDAVLIWPLCRETFSFTAYEAVAGGAAVITGPDSGNVAAFVESSGHGQVLPDEAALGLAVASGAIAGLARAVRAPRLFDLAFSGLTVDLLGAVAAPAGKRRARR
jgi:hypothetical protein